MYSALHIMQWFSQLLDVFTPKIKRKFFDFYILWIKTNVAYTRLEMIARTKCCTTTTASNWFVTLYYKLLPAVRSSSKHCRWWSSLLLYSISMYETHLASQEESGCVGVFQSVPYKYPPCIREGMLTNTYTLIKLKIIIGLCVSGLATFTCRHGLNISMIQWLSQKEYDWNARKKYVHNGTLLFSIISYLAKLLL